MLEREQEAAQEIRCGGTSKVSDTHMAVEAF